MSSLAKISNKIDNDDDDDDDDDGRTHENDAKTLSWHTVNASLWTGASYDGNNSSHLFWNLEDPANLLPMTKMLS